MLKNIYKMCVKILNPARIKSISNLIFICNRTFRTLYDIFVNNSGHKIEDKNKHEQTREIRVPSLKQK